jgi:hypothetical protein
VKTAERKKEHNRGIIGGKAAARWLFIILMAAFMVLLFPTPPLRAAERLYDMQKILNRKSVTDSYSPEIRSSLEKNGFVIVQEEQSKEKWSRWRHFYELYEHLRYEDKPALVTTDATLHYAHEVFDFSLSTTEEKALSPLVIKLMQIIRARTRKQIDIAPDREVKDAALKNLAYVSIASSILMPGEKAEPSVEELVKKERALIMSASGPSPSPLLGYVEDYTQYIPRGHYTRSDFLKRYFRALMWMGRAEFKPGKRPQLIQALLLTMALCDGDSSSENGFALWKRLNRTLTLLIGPCDNPTPEDYQALMQKVWGKVPALSGLSDRKKMEEFQKLAIELSAKKPRIVNPIEKDAKSGQAVASGEEGFRLAGQRFIPDSYIIQQLVYPRAGTVEQPRTMPSGLDVMAVLGSREAESLQIETEHRFINYNKQLSTLKGEFSSLPDKIWNSTAYWTWLDSLRPLLKERGAHYPPFMKNQEWRKKSLNTALGSWTELRHDTILYAKSTYAEGGEGRHFMPMVLAKGYVEPEPEVYSRIDSLCQKIRTLLDEEKLMTAPVKEVIAPYHDMVKSLLAISRKELGGKGLTPKEFNIIREYGRVMESVYTRISQEQKQRGGRVETSTMAVVADVHTDAQKGICLEEGVGLPNMILAIVSIDGELVLVQGGVFSHYEFTKPIGGRLTDEAWEKIILEGNAPPLMGWMLSLVKSRDVELIGKAVVKERLPEKLPAGTTAKCLRAQSLKQLSWSVKGGDFAPSCAPGCSFDLWSPGQIVYYSERSGAPQVWIAKSDGTGHMALTPEGVRAKDPCLLPYECKVVFSEAAQGGSRLMLYDYRTTYMDDAEKVLYPYPHKTVTLVSNGAQNLLPSSFPVRLEQFKWVERLIYSSTISGRSQLYLLDPGTSKISGSYASKSDDPRPGEIRQLTSLPGDNYQGAASPDGKRIAFTSKREGKAHIWVMDRDGRNLMELTYEGTSNTSPTWSPDGRMIAFVSNRGGKNNIWVMNAEGKEHTRLTDSTEEDMTPCWTPNPYEIIFASSRGGTVSHLWLMTLEVKK